MRFLVFLLAALLLASCERPFVDPDRPGLEVIEPDFSTIFPNTKLHLVVKASAFRIVTRVAVNNDSLTYDPDRQVWVGDYALREGLNRLIFSVTDSDDQTTFDTSFAVHGAFQVDQTAPFLPSPRGGHSATVVGDGTLVVIGGAANYNDFALESAVVLDPGAQSFRTLTGGMWDARSGHSATLLPDGRILILGGSRIEPAAAVRDLVESVELFNPETEAFTLVPFAGDPVRRAYHTASLHVEGSRVFIDVYGGDGDIAYRPSSSFAIRRDWRRFEFRNDSLVALSPAPGPYLDYALSGHTQTELEDFDSTEDKRFLIAGTYYASNVEENVSFVLDYASSTGIAQRPTGALIHERTRHASVALADGFVGTFGGNVGRTGQALNEVEVYSEEAGRFFVFPPANLLLRRFGLTATKLSNRRILLLGGFLSSGQGSAVSTIVWMPRL